MSTWFEEKEQQKELLRVKDVCRMLGVSRTVVWRMRKKGWLPPPVHVSDGVMGWPRSMIEDLIHGRLQRSEGDGS